MPYKDIEKRRATRRLYEEANRTKIRAQQAAMRERRSEELAEYQRLWRATHKTNAARHDRRQNLKSYGLTPEQYDAMLEKQGGVCAICRKAPPAQRRLAVDHDHVTGVVRGLLCTSCNLGLGKFMESLELLRRAVAYLQAAI